MNNSVEDSNIQLQKITFNSPKEWVSIIDKFCKISFIPRRKWILDAVYEKLERDNLLAK
jgi:hypothetical protein